MASNGLAPLTSNYIEVLLLPWFITLPSIFLMRVCRVSNARFELYSTHYIHVVNYGWEVFVLRFYPPLFAKNQYQTNMLLLGGYVHVLYTVPGITAVSFPLHVLFLSNLITNIWPNYTLFQTEVRKTPHALYCQKFSVVWRTLQHQTFSSTSLCTLLCKKGWGPLR